MTTLPTHDPTLTPLAAALSPASLVRVLRALYIGRKTGVLSFSRGRERLGLRFVSGRVVSGSDGPVGRLGEILLRLGAVSRRDLDRALEKAALQRLRLGPVLVAERIAARQKVREALRLQVRDVLFAAFFWGFGAYRFEADEGPDVHEDIDLEMSTPSLIVDVVSCLESPREVLRGITDLDQPVIVAADAAAALARDHVLPSASDDYVLSRAAAAISVRRVIDEAPLPAVDVERSVVALLCCDALRPLAVPALKPPPSPDQTVALPRASLGLGAAVAGPDATIAAPRASLGLGAAAEACREAARRLQAMEGQTHYAVLGLPEGASGQEVKRAFVRLAKHYHPDAARDRDLATLHKSIFIRVSEACNALASSEPRAERPVRRPLAGAPVRVSPSPAVFDTPEPASPLPELGEAVRRAEALLGSGEPFEAASLLTDVLPHTQGPLRRRAQLLRARAYLKTPSGSHLAEAEVRELLQEAPTCVEACLLLGDLYRDNGLARRAEAQYRRALALAPGNESAAAELDALSRAGVRRRAVAGR